jgi:hypothetical protein
LALYTTGCTAGGEEDRGAENHITTDDEVEAVTSEGQLVPEVVVLVADDGEMRGGAQCGCAGRSPTVNAPSIFTAVGQLRHVDGRGAMNSRTRPGGTGDSSTRRGGCGGCAM